MNEAREWLIRKNGYFYRPNRSGYTMEKVAAGRYTKAEADREASIEPENFTVLHESEVEDAPQVVDLNAIIASLRERLAEVEAERDRLCEKGFALIEERNVVRRQVECVLLREGNEKRRAETAEARVKQIRAETIEECASRLDEAARLKREAAQEKDYDPDHTILIRTAHNLEFEAAGIRALANETAGGGSE